MGCMHCGSQPGEHPEWCRGNIPAVYERLLEENLTMKEELRQKNILLSDIHKLLTRGNMEKVDIIEELESMGFNGLPRTG